MKTFLNIFCTFALIVLEVSAVDDYCNATLCQVGNPPTLAQHIDCNNSGRFAATCPANARIVNIASQQSLILQMINVRRNRVATGNLQGFPTASRMPTTLWSNDLARLAALSVRRCPNTHDSCRNTYTFRRVAQLVFNHFSIGPANINYRNHIILMIQAWFTRYQYANAAKMASFERSNPDYSAFAILVNQRVTHVGCGTVTYKRNRRLDVTTICNFGSRNTPGEAVYDNGTIAADCTTGTNPTYPGLCSTSEVVDPNVD